MQLPPILLLLKNGQCIWENYIDTFLGFYGLIEFFTIPGGSYMFNFIKLFIKVLQQLKTAFKTNLIDTLICIGENSAGIPNPHFIQEVYIAFLCTLFKVVAKCRNT